MLKIITKKTSKPYHSNPALADQRHHTGNRNEHPGLPFFSDTDRKIPLWTARGGSLLGKTCEFKTISYGSGLST
jgi:hypothetical protein